jgi:hypothetical protein
MPAQWSTHRRQNPIGELTARYRNCVHLSTGRRYGGTMLVVPRRARLVIAKDLSSQQTQAIL